MSGLIFDIQRFSTHDGPGIRSTVFFKGCGLRCFWCHNPESLSSWPELMTHTTRCIRCGVCERACPEQALTLSASGLLLRRERCQVCGACVAACPAKALSMAGRSVDAEEVMETIRRDAPFYAESGGGVTFSGGEPLLQPEFLCELLRHCRREGFHTAVDTAGYVPYAKIEALLPEIDLFLYDLKTADDAVHRTVTGHGNQRILENLNQLLCAGAQLQIRIPVVPGVNDTTAAMERVAALLRDNPPSAGVRLLRFHRLGSVKYEALGLENPSRRLDPPHDAVMRELAAVFRRYGHDTEIM